MLYRLLLGFALVGFALNIVGIVVPNDKRELFGVEYSYVKALADMDQAYTEFGSSPEFLERVTKIYANAIEYVWPIEMAQVPITDNWILHSLGYFDWVFLRLGVSQVEHLFAEFQSLDYTRAFRRGYGICSQNAISMSDLLQRRYHIESYVVGLQGHVILEAVVADQPMLLDPSVGVSMDMGFEGLSQQALPNIAQKYAEVGFPELSQSFDPAGNIREPRGPQGYQPKVFLLERAANWLVWVVPGLAFLLGLFGLRNTRRASTR